MAVLRVSDNVSLLLLLLLVIESSNTVSVKPNTDRQLHRSRNRSILLKNANPNLVVFNITSAPYQNITDKIEINPDSEPISLTHKERIGNTDKVLERLTNTTPRNLLGTSFDEALLDFSAYLTKPFVFDYSKALNEAVEHAKNDVLSTNYNLDASTFEGSDLYPIENHKPVSEPPPPQYNETISFDDSSSGPRAEKLVRQPESEESSIYRNFDETKLPLGFAFFEALREQNNRPYFEAFARTTTQVPFIPSTTELPSTEAIATTRPSTSFRRRNAKKTSEFGKERYNNENDQETPSFTEYNNSDESSDHDSYKFDENYNPYYQESEEVTEGPKYTVTNTDTNTYGSKPGMKFNRYSRLKLIQQQKPITKAKPTGFAKKNYSPKRQISQTSSTNNLPVKVTLTKHSNRKSSSAAPYLYDDEVYHPNESKEFLIVVTTKPPPSEDQESAASAQQAWRQVAPQFASLNQPRPQDIEHVHPVTTRKPIPVPRPSKSPPPARKPSQQKPPEEMRFFQ